MHYASSTVNSQYKRYCLLNIYYKKKQYNKKNGYRYTTHWNPLAASENQRAAHLVELLIWGCVWGVCTCILLQRAQDTNREQDRVA